MSQNCNCLEGLGNLGYPQCVTSFGRVYSLILVSLYGSNGSKNFYDPATALDQAFLDGKINEVNHLDRWYPTPELKNFAPTTADTVFQEYEDGTKDRVRAGVMSFTGIFNNKNHTFACKLNHNNCSTFGVYLVDENGLVMGVNRGDGKLYPVPVQGWDVKYNFTSNTELSNVMISFDFKPAYGVCDLDIVEAEADMIEAKGLIDAYATVVTSTVGNLVVKFNTSYGTLGNKQGVKGVAVADIISLKNVTQSTTLTVVSVTESTTVEGQYTIVYTAGGTVATNILRLEIQVDGYDFNPVTNTQIVVA